MLKYEKKNTNEITEFSTFTVMLRKRSKLILGLLNKMTPFFIRLVVYVCVCFFPFGVASTVNLIFPLL